MDVARTTAVLPAADLERVGSFYKGIGFEVTMGLAGLTVGDAHNRFFVYPSQAASSGAFTQVALQVPDVRTAFADLKARGIHFEEYDTPTVKTQNGIARMPDGDAVAWFKDSEGNLLVIVPDR